MPIISRNALIIGVVALINVATPVFAEAPVFDADAVQQQFDSSDAEQSQQDLPPPPPPSSEQAFVPAQSSASSASAASAPPAAAASGSGSVDQRLRRVEQQMTNLQNNETTSRVESLQEQVQSMRGQVEQLTHQLQQVQDQQKVILSKKAGVGVPDADTQPVKASEKTTKIAAAKQTAKTTVGVDDKKPTGDQPDVAEEQQIYQTAYNMIKAKKYNDAVTALNGMLKKYPSGQFASNAHYWLGELYGLMGKNDQALTEFDTVVATYPDSPRVSDAQLKVGLIYSTQSKWGDAKTSFKKVINHYPGTASARVASEQLKQIKSAGH